MSPIAKKNASSFVSGSVSGASVGEEENLVITVASSTESVD
jgi:hypothetical protein